MLVNNIVTLFDELFVYLQVTWPKLSDSDRDWLKLVSEAPDGVAQFTTNLKSTNYKYAADFNDSTKKQPHKY